MRSKLFYDGHYEDVATRIKDFLNQQQDFLSGNTIKSTRAAGDAIEDILSDNFENLLTDTWCKQYSSQFARRAMADLAFNDHDDLYYVVDVKTHRLSTKFNMPNLTSVQRLARFYEDDTNYFVVLMVSYDIKGHGAEIDKVEFVPIEFLGWDCLTIGALGWGQIQIANSNFISINSGYSRRTWMIELCDTLLEFYPKEIAKIDSRIKKFEKIKAEWEAKPE
ncbi:MAG: hypothetical protein MI757_09615 [Pirellulales bacterium]|nr:hypothetical protein [Pirellulales bacterium]